MAQNCDSFITEKNCSRCTVIKPIAEFSKDRQHSSGYKSACKVCARGDFVKWRTENLEYARRADRVGHYMRSYRLTQEQAEQLVENRVGPCAICTEVKPLVVDHCHTTGDVRGLVCSACNSVLGYAKDNTKTLLSAIAYLEDFYNGSESS